MNTCARQLARHQCDLPGRHSQDQADIGLGGVDTLERMHSQEEPGESGHLVGAHQPGADRDQQHELGRERDQAQTPQGDRAHATGGVEHQLYGAWIWSTTGLGRGVGELGRGDGVLAGYGHEPFAWMGGAAAQGMVLGEGGLDLGSQLVGVVGQAQQA